MDDDDGEAEQDILGGLALGRDDVEEDLDGEVQKEQEGDDEDAEKLKIN